MSYTHVRAIASVRNLHDLKVTTEGFSMAKAPIQQIVRLRKSGL